MGKPLYRYGKRLGTQNMEGGMIEHVFETIGHGSRKLVEVGYEMICNSANLLSNHKWYGWLFDANPENAPMAEMRWWKRCKPATSFITKENVNELMRRNGVPTNIDFLSIDIDGNDYWVWKEMYVDSRLVVIEYNASLGPEESLTIEYNPSFNRKEYHPFYHGASLRALTRLANKKGCALIGCERSGVNAFFLKRSELCGDLEEVSVEEAYFPHRSRVDWKHSLEELKEKFSFVEV